MPRMIKKLAPVAVKTLPAGMHADGGGLYLHVNAAGARSWIFRYMIAGRQREMGLGPTFTVSLKDARERATQCRRQLLDGIDPIEARNARKRQAALEAARELSFEAWSRRYIDTHRADWKNPKHAAQWTSTLEAYAFPMIGAQPVRTIDTALVLKVVQPIWAAIPETADRVRGRIETILDAAKTADLRAGENPARWKGHLKNLLPGKAKMKAAKRAAAGKGEHQPAMPYGEIAAFMAELGRREVVSARALEFAILTAARTGEVLGMTWPEVDFPTATWTIPAARMKAGKEHRVPLSDSALKLLRAQRPAGDGHVFPGARPGRKLSNMAFLMLLRRMGRGDLTGHGFRSAFASWADECTDFPEAVIEMTLAHTVADKVLAAYHRGELLRKRRQLIQAWAAFCTGAEPAPDKVVALYGLS